MYICSIYTNFANQWVTTYTHSLKEHKKGALLVGYYGKDALFSRI